MFSFLNKLKSRALHADLLHLHITELTVHTVRQKLGVVSMSFGLNFTNPANSTNHHSESPTLMDNSDLKWKGV